MGSEDSHGSRQVYLGSQHWTLNKGEPESENGREEPGPRHGCVTETTGDPEGRHTGDGASSRPLRDAASGTRRPRAAPDTALSTNTLCKSRKSPYETEAYARRVLFN